MGRSGFKTKAVAVRVEEKPKIPQEKFSITDDIVIIDVSNG